MLWPQCPSYQVTWCLSSQSVNKQSLLLALCQKVVQYAFIMAQLHVIDSSTLLFWVHLLFLTVHEHLNLQQTLQTGIIKLCPVHQDLFDKHWYASSRKTIVSQEVMNLNDVCVAAQLKYHLTAPPLSPCASKMESSVCLEIL